MGLLCELVFALLFVVSCLFTYFTSVVGLLGNCWLLMFWLLRGLCLNCVVRFGLGFTELILVLELIAGWFARFVVCWWCITFGG